jgi:hypothetical protein
MNVGGTCGSDLGDRAIVSGDDDGSAGLGLGHDR